MGELIKYVKVTLLKYEDKYLKYHFFLKLLTTISYKLTFLRTFL